MCFIKIIYCKSQLHQFSAVVEAVAAVATLVIAEIKTVASAVVMAQVIHLQKET